MANKVDVSQQGDGWYWQVKYEVDGQVTDWVGPYPSADVARQKALDTLPETGNIVNVHGDYTPDPAPVRVEGIDRSMFQPVEAMITEEWNTEPPAGDAVDEPTGEEPSGGPTRSGRRPVRPR